MFSPKILEEGIVPVSLRHLNAEGITRLQLETQNQKQSCMLTETVVSMASLSKLLNRIVLFLLC